MDFGTLLDFAKQNEKPAKEVRCYRTSFAPPTKQPKSKSLSENIQKFLARKEEEDRKKTNAANKKREGLFALRAQDSKANKRIQAMLKSTKAANKAAIDDARDDVNTAVTMAGPSQPDEDDYGYVSQEASAFYNKLMDKYSSTPTSEPKFSKKSQSVKDLSSTKDRVRMALLKEEEEESMGHKRKRRTKEEMRGKHDGDIDEGIQYGMPDRGVSERETGSSSNYTSREKPEPEIKKRKPSLPPPMDFAELLKVAAQKQFEPIKIEKKETNNDDERPMTKKQREEYLREKEYRLRKEEMARASLAKPKEKQQPSSSQTQADTGDTRINSASKAPSIPRIPKLNGAKANSESQTRISGNDTEIKMKRNGPQPVSCRELNHSKQKSTEIGRQNHIKSSSSAREQDIRANEGKKNSMQQNNKFKDSYPDRKPLPVQNVPSSKERRLCAEEKQITQSSKPVIREEKRQINQSLKPVIKEERRQINNQSSKPVIKEERRQISQSPRPMLKEERKLPPENSRIPAKSGKAAAVLDSKYNQPSQQSNDNSKIPPNPVKKMDEKTSRNVPVSHTPPHGSSMLKERLSGANNQSLPQKNHPGLKQEPKKELRTDPPPKSRNISNAPPVRSSLPKETPNRPPVNRPPINRPPVNRPQVAGSQGTSREGARGCPPNRRRDFPDRGEIRRPPSMYDRGPPGARGFPPNRQRPPHPQDGRRQPAGKRRIESDDEYDSELDDFIDDGPEESEDYSKYIKEIFGYDKSRYTVHDYDDDDECMESNFAQQMKEEFVSTKLGIMEDLEDIKKEQMEKKKKMMGTAKKKKM